MKRIALMCTADFIEPFKKEGFEVLWTLDVVYPLFYEGKNTVSLSLDEFKARLSQYKEKVLEFNPVYFLADSGFFSGILNRLDAIKKKDMSALWVDFINDLNKAGVITIVSCVDDPWQFVMDRRYVLPVRNAFRVVKNNTMQLAAAFKKQGQQVMYFPDYVRICFDDFFRAENDPLLENKIRDSVFDFDVFFTGRMDMTRKIFFWRLSRKLKGLDYFFGGKDFFYTSRDKVDFDVLNRYHLQQIYKRASVNVVYGSMNEFFLNKTWAVSDRIFNIAYCGGFFLTDYRRHLPGLFDGEPTAYSFKNLNDCHEKIRFYLENKDLRLSMADKFREQAILRHTADERIKQFVRELESIKTTIQ